MSEIGFVGARTPGFLPKLIYSSPRGRIEVSTRPDGAVRFDMVAGTTEELDAGEVLRLIDRLHRWELEAEQVD